MMGGKQSASTAVPAVLVVDDDSHWREQLSHLIRRAYPSVEISLAASYEEAKAELAGDKVWALVATDVALSADDVDGLGMIILRTARKQELPVVVVSITEKVRAQGAVSAERCGARFFGKRQLAREESAEDEFVAFVRDILTNQQRALLAGPVKVFISYSHEDAEFCESLEQHLALLKRTAVISVWRDRRIGPGKEWQSQIDRYLNGASLILLLVSHHFMASDDCFDVETKLALEHHRSGRAVVIPVICSPCDWRAAPFAGLQVLPSNGRPVTTWEDQNEAFLDVVEGVRQAALQWQQQRGHSENDADAC